MSPNPPGDGLDPQTVAAVNYMLEGKGAAKSGQYFVTVHGGRIVAVQDVDRKVPAADLTKPVHDKPATTTVYNLRNEGRRQR